MIKEVITELAYQGNEQAMDWIEEYLALYWAKLEWEYHEQYI